MDSLPTALSPEQLTVLKEQNHDAEIIIVAVVFSVLSICSMALRLTSRHMKNNAIEVDDLLMLFALTIALAETIWVVVGLRDAGLGRHLLMLTSEQLIRFNKLWYGVGLLQPTVLAITKVSVLILFHRIFVTPQFRRATWILGLVVILWWIGNFFADALICIPVEINWDPTVRGRCGNKYVLGIVTPLPWIATDLAILILPLPTVWNLHLPALQKFGLAVLFLLGSFSLVASCVRYSTLFFLRSDVTWYIVPSAIWSIIESNVTIISACLIVSRPWLLKLYPEKLISLVRETLTIRIPWQKTDITAPQAARQGRGRKRWLPLSSFSRLVESPPILPESAMGVPFGWDVEKSVDHRVVHLEGIEESDERLSR